jgi:hypothetical protein
VEAKLADLNVKFQGAERKQNELKDQVGWRRLNG